jgi:hypothetical protein
MNIKFITTNLLGENGFFLNKPESSKKYIPEWYKKMPNTIDLSSRLGLSPDSKYASNSTVKGCTPFLDAMITGYIYSLSADIEIKLLDDNEISIKWRPDIDLISYHDQNQAPNFPNPAEVNKSSNILKWNSPFSIKTPDGYSCLFTHPLNRYDLPFRTLSGVIDTDSYNLAPQFPFQLSIDIKDTIIIEKGTPIVQIIPFKRDIWKSSYEDESIIISNRNSFNYFSTIIKSYKNKHWSKKIYE